MKNKPNRIIVHHTADNSLNPQDDKIDAYHKSLGFPLSELGSYIGYHYLIGRGGYVYICRNETEIGAHDKDENINSIGIALEGNFNTETPTTAQCTAYASLVDGVLQRWNIPISRIEPHRWGDNTDCPGNRLNDFWGQETYIRQKIGWIKRILLWLSQTN